MGGEKNCPLTKLLLIILARCTD